MIRLPPLVLVLAFSCACCFASTISKPIVWPAQPADFDFGPAVELRKVRFARQEGRGVSVLAAEDIAEGETVIRVNYDVALSKRDMLSEFPAFAAAFDASIKEGHTFHEHVMGYYIALKYLRHDENTVPNAIRFSPHSCFDGQDFLHDVVMHFPTGSFERFFDYILLEHMRFRIVDAALPQELRISYRDYLWGVCIARTRAFNSVPNVAELHGSFNFVPAGDFFNDDAELENVRYASDGQHWMFTAVKNISKGDELYIVYECKSRLDMLRNYGFATNDKKRRKCDYVVINNRVLMISENGKVHFEDSKERVTPALLREEIARYNALTPLLGTNDLVLNVRNHHIQFLKEALELIQKDQPRAEL